MNNFPFYDEFVVNSKSEIYKAQYYQKCRS